MQTTLVFGASLKTNRYSNIAVKRLVENNIPTEAFGLKIGNIHGVKLTSNINYFKNIHTITLYLNPKNQEQYYDAIIDMAPQRVIFNPGTENPFFFKLLKDNNIAVEVACTLVLLSTGQY